MQHLRITLSYICTSLSLPFAHADIEKYLCLVAGLKAVTALRSPRKVAIAVVWRGFIKGDNKEPKTNKRILGYTNVMKMSRDCSEN